MTSPKTPPQIPLARANTALTQARELRAEWKTGLTVGTVTLADLLLVASTPGGAPLRRMTLRQALLSVPGWGQERADQALQRLLFGKNGTGLSATAPSELTCLTVAWLLDTRARGSRLTAWLNATDDLDEPLQTGFPWNDISPTNG